MVGAAFSRQAFARVLRAGDSTRFGVDLKTDRESIISAAIERANDPTELNQFETVTINGKPCVFYSDYASTLTLRALANHVRQALKIPLPNREEIIRGVVQTIEDATPMAIYRRDLTSFYETIPLRRMREALLDSAVLSPTASRVLERYFAVHCSGKTSGLPRGLSLSAVLAEWTLQEFDQAIRSNPAIHRHFRFSDDMLIVSHDVSLNLNAVISSALPDALQLNPKKQFNLAVGTGHKQMYFDYLVYGFYLCEDVNAQSCAPREISVCISTRKISKIKSRVIMSLKDFRKTHDSALLVDRLIYLTSNYGVPRTKMTTRGRRRRVNSGIYFNYSLCKNGKTPTLPRYTDGLSALDGFTQSL